METNSIARVKAENMRVVDQSKEQSVSAYPNVRSFWTKPSMFLQISQTTFITLMGNLSLHLINSTTA